ncbi:MAG: CDP-alcohol phosphatidyltransferase family protein [Actinomycetota bacterium]
MTYPTPQSQTGAKKRDYFWTVLAVDPVAFPIVRLLARKRWLSPDQVTAISFVMGIATGPLYGIGERWSLAVGAVVYYLSFMLDCVDGKLARITGNSTDRGKALDALADSARRASAILGIIWFLIYDGDTSATELFLAAAFAVLSFYFMEISGAEKQEPKAGALGKWNAMLAKRRLLPTPGMPDVSAIVFFLGPLTLLIVPALWVGLAMVVVGIALTARRRLLT